MKKLLLLLSIIISLNASAQRLVLDIEPLDVCHSGVTLELSVVSTTVDSATVYYSLWDSTGRKFEDGNKNVPIQALSIIAQKPISIPAFNILLATWNITAIRIKEE